MTRTTEPAGRGSQAPKRFRPRLLATLVTLVCVAILIGLGVWQLERRAWKHDLMAQLDERLAAEPASLSDPVGDPGALAYRPVRLEGVYLNDREIHRVSRTLDGQVGVHVITPLRLEDGRELLVNRGWVPNDLRAQEARPDSLVEGPVEVVGLLREGGWDGVDMFRPANDPAQNNWMWMDLPAMTAAADLETPITEVYVDLRDSAPGSAPAGDYPVPGTTVVELPDNHLQYALTWFSLAVVLAAVYVISQRRPMA